MVGTRLWPAALRNSCRCGVTFTRLDYTTYVPPSTQHLATFTGYYTVPGNPSDTTGDEVLFYFIGMWPCAALPLWLAPVTDRCSPAGTENINQQDVAILQPVLTWGNGLTGWSYASWNCCPSGQQHESTPIQGFGAGDKLYGEILRDNGSWTISSIHGAQNTSLTVADNGRNFDWMDVTLYVVCVCVCLCLHAHLARSCWCLPVVRSTTSTAARTLPRVP